MDKKLLVSVAMATPFAAFAADAVQLPVGWNPDAEGVLTYEVGAPTEGVANAWAPSGYISGSMADYIKTTEEGVTVFSADAAVKSVYNNGVGLLTGIYLFNTTGMTNAAVKINGSFYLWQVEVDKDGKEIRRYVVTDKSSLKGLSFVKPGADSKAAAVRYYYIPVTDLDETCKNAKGLQVVANATAVANKTIVIEQIDDQVDFTIGTLSMTLQFDFKGVYEELKAYAYGDNNNGAMPDVKKISLTETLYVNEGVSSTSDNGGEEYSATDRPGSNYTALNKEIEKEQTAQSTWDAAVLKLDSDDPQVLYEVYLTENLSEWNEVPETDRYGNTTYGADGLSQDLKTLVAEVNATKTAVDKENTLFNNWAVNSYNYDTTKNKVGTLQENYESNLTAFNDALKNNKFKQPDGFALPTSITTSDGKTITYADYVNNAVGDYTATVQDAINALTATLGEYLNNGQIIDTKIVNPSCDYNIYAVEQMVNNMQGVTSSNVYNNAIDTWKDYCAFWLTAATVDNAAINLENVVTDATSANGPAVTETLGYWNTKLATDEGFTALEPSKTYGGTPAANAKNIYQAKVADTLAALGATFAENKGYGIEKDAIEEYTVIPSPDSALSSSQESAAERVNKLNTQGKALETLCTTNNDEWSMAMAQFKTLNDAYEQATKFISSSELTKVLQDKVVADGTPTTDKTFNDKVAAEKKKITDAQKTYKDVLDALYTYDRDHYIALDLNTSATEYIGKKSAVDSAKTTFENAVKGVVPAGMDAYINAVSDLNYSRASVVSLCNTNGVTNVKTFTDTFDNLSTALTNWYAANKGKEVADQNTTLLNTFAQNISSYYQECVTVLSNIGDVQAELNALTSQLTAFNSQINSNQGLITGAGYGETNAKTIATAAYNSLNGDVNGKAATATEAATGGFVGDLANAKNQSTPQEVYAKTNEVKDAVSQFITNNAVKDAEGNITFNAQLTFAKGVNTANQNFVKSQLGNWSKYADPTSTDNIYKDAPGYQEAIKNISLSSKYPSTPEGINDPSTVFGTLGYSNTYTDATLDQIYAVDAVYADMYDAYKTAYRQLVLVMQNYDTNQALLKLLNGLDNNGGVRKAIDDLNTNIAVITSGEAIAYYRGNANGIGIEALNAKYTEVETAIYAAYNNWPANPEAASVAQKAVLEKQISDLNGMVTALEKTVRDNDTAWKAQTTASGEVGQYAQQVMDAVAELGDLPDYEKEFNTEIQGYLDELAKINADIATDFGKGESAKEMDARLEAIAGIKAKINTAYETATGENSGFMAALEKTNNAALDKALGGSIAALEALWKSCTDQIATFQYGITVYAPYVSEIRDEIQQINVNEIQFMQDKLDNLKAARTALLNKYSVEKKVIDPATMLTEDPTDYDILFGTEEDENGDGYPDGGLRGDYTDINEGFTGALKNLNETCDTTADEMWTSVYTNGATKLLNGTDGVIATMNKLTGKIANNRTYTTKKISTMSKTLVDNNKTHTNNFDALAKAITAYANAAADKKDAAYKAMNTAYATYIVDSDKQLENVAGVSAQVPDFDQFIYEQCKSTWTENFNSAVQSLNYYKTDAETYGAYGTEALAVINESLTIIGNLNTQYENYKDNVEDLEDNLAILLRGYTDKYGVYVPGLEKAFNDAQTAYYNATIEFNNDKFTSIVKPGLEADAASCKKAIEDLIKYGGHGHGDQEDLAQALWLDYYQLTDGIAAASAADPLWERENDEEGNWTGKVLVAQKWIDLIDQINDAVEEDYANMYQAEYAYVGGELMRLANQAYDLYVNNGNPAPNSDQIAVANTKLNGFKKTLDSYVLGSTETQDIYETNMDNLEGLEADMVAYIMDLKKSIPANLFTPVENAKAAIEYAYKNVVAEISAAQAQIDAVQAAHDEKYLEKINGLETEVAALKASLDEIYADYGKMTEPEDDPVLITAKDGFVSSIGIIGSRIKTLQASVETAQKAVEKANAVDDVIGDLTKELDALKAAAESAYGLADEAEVADKTEDLHNELFGYTYTDEQTGDKVVDEGVFVKDAKAIADKKKVLMDPKNTETAEDIKDTDYSVLISTSTSIASQYVAETLENVVVARQDDVKEEAQVQIEIVEDNVEDGVLYVDDKALIAEFKAILNEIDEVPVEDLTETVSVDDEIDPGYAQRFLTPEEAEEVYNDLMAQLDELSAKIKTTAENGNKYNKYELGDVNLDGGVSMIDYSIVLGWVLDNTGSAASLYRKMVNSGNEKEVAQAHAADVTEDKKISTADANAIVRIILNDGEEEDETPAARFARRNAKAPEANLSMSFVYVGSVDGHDRYALMLDNDATILSTQFDVKLPAGMNIVGVSNTERTASHDVYYNVIEDNLRVVLFESGNASFLGNSGAIAFIDVDGEGLELKNAAFADDKFNTIELSASGTTITDMIIDGANKAKDMIYDAAGRMYNSLQRGVNIIRKGDGTTTKEIRK